MTDLDLELLKESLRAPTASKADVEHANAEHPLPYGWTEPISFPDGCRFVPVHPGTWLYERPTA